MSSGFGTNGFGGLGTGLITGLYGPGAGSGIVSTGSTGSGGGITGPFGVLLSLEQRGNDVRNRRSKETMLMKGGTRVFYPDNPNIPMVSRMGSGDVRFVPVVVKRIFSYSAYLFQ